MKSNINCGLLSMSIIKHSPATLMNCRIFVFWIIAVAELLLSGAAGEGGGRVYVSGASGEGT